ncbi:uncharacterized protein E0L32_011935 [Thyridium curvatum]|uniref:Uncharacterized protein n=1 Tax=Thyridium curvatum TaxID=1093900 RepID=A0A507BMJ1_9PEZI|nr:uncharacterized protein E0L32_011935 [Thyridium curvatum]TPX17988.1 hypothetical protein E0L32_011935 [Thyridium curvatum]
MRAALNQRRTHLDQFSPLVTSRELASSRSSRSTVAIKGWQAFRLQKSITFSASGPVQQTKSERSCKYAARHVKALIGHPTTPDRYQTASWLDVLDVVDAVRSMSSPFHLFLPPATEPGDWVLRSFRPSQDMQRCLVVRKALGENVLCVVGQGIYVRGSYDADTLGSDTSDNDGFEVDTDCDDDDFMFSARREQFCVTFDVEDLLVFMSQPGLNLSDAGDACGDLIFERLNTGVCGRINSSFAKRIK